MRGLLAASHYIMADVAQDYSCSQCSSNPSLVYLSLSLLGMTRIKTPLLEKQSEMKRTHACLCLG